MNQRKRKLDFVPYAENKRRPPGKVKAPRTKPRQQASLLEELRPGLLPNGERQAGDSLSIMMETETDAIDQDIESDSEDDAPESALSSDTETTSDSGISASDSGDEEEDQPENLRHDLSTRDPASDQDSLGDDTNIISLPPRLKPAISGATIMSGSSALRSRIAAFLPQLRQANEDLTNAEDDHRIDTIADDQDHYIEMDLGLGVLKEKPRRGPLHGEIRTRKGSITSSSSSVSSSSSSSSSGSSNSDGDQETKRPKKDPMREFLGKNEKLTRQEGTTIQVLDET